MSTTSGQERIVVGIDGSPEATAALSWAIDEARLRGVGLRVIHVFPALISLVATTAHEYWPQVVKEQQAMFDQVMAAAPAMDDLDVERSLIHGNPAEVLVDSSRGANLLVIGYRGRGGFGGMLLGSVSISLRAPSALPGRGGSPGAPRRLSARGRGVAAGIRSPHTRPGADRTSDPPRAEAFSMAQVTRRRNQRTTRDAPTAVA